jgi:hypothetical protein
MLTYNNAVQTVPTSIGASMTRFRQREFSTAPDAERAPVQVRSSGFRPDADLPGRRERS